MIDILAIWFIIFIIILMLINIIFSIINCIDNKIARIIWIILSSILIIEIGSRPIIFLINDMMR